MSYKRRRDSGYETLSHSDYLNLSKKYPYLDKHFSNDKYRRFEYIHEDSTYHLSKASLLEFYGIHLKLPCLCPILPFDDSNINSKEIIWNPKLVSKCDMQINQNTEYFSYKIHIPIRYLSPCIPGRKLYLDTINSLLEQIPNYNKYNNNIKVLDIGTGASAIYALLGSTEYGWSFIATDISDDALTIAQHNIQINELDSKIELRKQTNPLNMYSGVIDNYEFFHFTICNPPFYTSYDERRDNLNTHKMGSTEELIFNISNNSTIRLSQSYRDSKNQTDDYIIYPPETFDLNNLDKYPTCGELAFIMLMILESRFYCKNVLWFTSLVSKKFNLKKLKQIINKEMTEYHSRDLDLQNIQNSYLDFWSKRIKETNIKSDVKGSIECKLNSFKIREIRTFEIKPGKLSRWILCWTFYNSQQRDLILKSLNVH